MATEFPPDACSFASQRQEALHWLEQGKYAAALHQFALASRTMQNPDNLVDQAVCLIHLEQAHEASQLCDRALELNPSHPQAWLFKGVALHRLGQYDQAYACYGRAVGKPSRQRTVWQGRKRPRFKAWRSFCKRIKNVPPLHLWVH